MWELLDEKYGKISKLIDVVVNHIRRLKIAHEGEGQKFLYLIDTVKCRYRDLFRMKLDKEISNNTVVSMIEEKLQKDIGLEWVKEVTKTGSSVKDNNKFSIPLKVFT